MPNTRANASAQRRSPRGSASRENGDEHENFNTPSHRAARAAANMSEQEYATLHRHPDEEYIAENLAKRIEEEARNERERALREQLEEHLRRQADISGGEARERAGQGDLNGSRPREPRVPRSL